MKKTVCSYARRCAIRKIRKVLVKSDVSFIENQTLEVILEKLEEVYDCLLPYYEATRF